MFDIIKAIVSFFFSVITSIVMMFVLALVAVLGIAAGTKLVEKMGSAKTEA